MIYEKWDWSKQTIRSSAPNTQIDYNKKLEDSSQQESTIPLDLHVSHDNKMYSYKMDKK